MNRDPFLRAGLILVFTGAASVLYAFFGPWRALAIAAVGVAAALFVSVDAGSPPTREELKEALRPERPSTDSEGRPRGFDRMRG